MFRTFIIVWELLWCYCSPVSGSFHTVHGVLKARILKWFAIPFSSEPHFVRTLPMVHLLKTIIFPVVMYGWESWTIKTAEPWRLDAFELWCWRRLLRAPWTARRSNLPISKSVLNIHWKDWCWNWNSNTLATWCEELIHWKRPWCWERLKVGGEGNDSGWDGWMSPPMQWTWVWVGFGSWWWTEKPGMLQSMGLQRVRHDWVTEMNWTELSLWVTHQAGIGFDLVLIVPLPLWYDFFVLGVGYPFLVDFSILLSMFVQQLFVIFVFSQEGMRTRSLVHHLEPETSIASIKW